MTRPDWTRSVRFQLTFWYVTTLAAILLLAAVLLYEGLSRAMLRETDQMLATQAAQIVRLLTAPPDEVASGKDTAENPAPAAVVAQAIPQTTLLRGVSIDPVYLRLARADNHQVVAVSRNLVPGGALAATLPIPAQRRPVFVFAGPDEETRVRCLTLPVPQTPYLLQVATPWDGTEDLLTSLMLGISAAVLLFLLLSGVGGWLLVGRAFRPMESIVSEAEQLTAERLTLTSLPPRAVSDNEIGHLVAALNRMLARLSGAFATQRQFTADASHEMRTPLTILQGELELALARERPAADYRNALESGLEETRRLARIVDGLAFLAHDDAGVDGHRSRSWAPVSLTSLAGNALHALTSSAQKKQQTVAVQGENDTFVLGDEEALDRVARNLLDNAIRYTPPGGRITISAEETPSDCRLTVTDTGIGVAPEDMPFIFDRFYRADKARVNDGGSGLGLSICQSIVTAHGGRLEAMSTPGVGSRFTMALPKISEF